MRRTFAEEESDLVDLSTWERRPLFEFFRGFSEPYHGVCCRVDCTETVHFAKEARVSVFLSLLHRSLVAANQIENFRLRMISDSVHRFARIHGGSAVGRPNGTIGFGYYPFDDDITQFIQAASLEVERVKRRKDIQRYANKNVIRYSVLPWLDFTSVSHARDYTAMDSAPFITFGKISESAGRFSMPVSIHVHHALADGAHVAAFVELFSKYLAEPQLHQPTADSED